MADNEKTTHIEAIEKRDSNPVVVETKQVKGSAAYNEALIKEPVSFRNPTTIRYACTRWQKRHHRG